MFSAKDLRENWPKIERDFMPLIRAKARYFERLAPGSHFGYDDAIQEGRLFLYEAFQKYEKDRGEIKSFASVLIDNKFRVMLKKMLTQKRVPKAFYLSEHDTWERFTAPHLDFDEIEIACDQSAIDVVAEHKELEAKIKAFSCEMLKTFKGLNRQVFECLVNPSLEFLRFVQKDGGNLERPTCKQIADFIGVKLNAVLWSVSYIRLKFTEFAKCKAYEELFGDLVRPIFYVGSGFEFVNSIIKEKCLSGPQIYEGLDFKGVSRDSGDGTFRFDMKKFPWGFVLFLKYREKEKTVLVDGDFLLLKGIGVSRNGMREKIPVTWYQDLIRRLRG